MSQNGKSFSIRWMLITLTWVTVVYFAGWTSHRLWRNRQDAILAAEQARISKRNVLLYTIEVLERNLKSRDGVAAVFIEGVDWLDTPDEQSRVVVLVNTKKPSLSQELKSDFQAIVAQHFAGLDVERVSVRQTDRGGEPNPYLDFDPN